MSSYLYLSCSLPFCGLSLRVRLKTTHLITLNTLARVITSSPQRGSYERILRREHSPRLYVQIWLHGVHIQLPDE